MRAGRLLNLLLLLQNGGRITARELAARLQVSERTVLRDLEALGSAGVPVYAVRGRAGGFELLDTFDQSVPPLPPGLTTAQGQLRRVRVRLSPAALQVAVTLGKPEAWRPRPNARPHPERPDWVEGSFRYTSYHAAERELLGLGGDVEVLLPEALRHAMANTGRRISDLHGPLTDSAAELSEMWD
ncbi:MAG: HTH domain-containing protein [Ornithinimicrobium sp.]